MTEIHKLNLMGVVLPFCLLEFKNALTRLGQGQMLEILLQDPDVLEDILRLVERSQDRLIEQKRVGRHFSILVERTGNQKKSVKEEA
ncbi:MAG: sulfurtransferase TusA family protein [Pseudomonadota bacterium]